MKEQKKCKLKIYLGCTKMSISLKVVVSPITNETNPPKLLCYTCFFSMTSDLLLSLLYSAAKILAKLISNQSRSCPKQR